MNDRRFQVGDRVQVQSPNDGWNDRYGTVERVPRVGLHRQHVRANYVFVRMDSSGLLLRIHLLNLKGIKDE
jgi:hypothetical protein